MITSAKSLALWPDRSLGPRSGVHRMLYCYAHERLARKLRDLLEVQEAAYLIAMEHGYDLGPLFVEEDGSGRAMQSLVEAATSHIGGAAVAIPHRGHLIPLGGPLEWQAFLEESIGHPLLFTGHTP